MVARYEGYQQLAFDYPLPRVLRISFNNPARRNSMTEIMHAESVRVWREVDEDPEISAVILTGKGPSFSTGGDRDMIRNIMADFQARARVWKEARDLVYNMINCSKPIVCSVRGHAFGAGLVCALMSDISIVAKDAKLLDGHTLLGVAAGDHAAMIWPLLCGMAKAKYYLLLCEEMTGEEAEKIGLVSMAVDEPDLDAKALEIAERLSKGAPNAIRFTKYAMNNWLRAMGPTFDASLALEFMGFTAPDVVEGLASLSEKRKANFDQTSPL
ncbi:MAG: enoyl-CoA hydratase/isomerase family protein [Mesorhizobium sp.]|nr:enoyl-CoA hydratase/isomerase family protein [Mesorhizobium sp.]